MGPKKVAQYGEALLAALHEAGEDGENNGELSYEPDANAEEW